MAELHDAWWCLPSRVEIERAAERLGCDMLSAAEKLLSARDMMIAEATSNPLEHGFEPPIWWVYDALVDFPVCSPYARNELAWRLGRPADKVFEEFKGRMRERLGFKRAVRHVLVNGGNRTSKSDMAAKKCDQLALHKTGAQVWALFEKMEESQLKQQPLFWRYLPPELQHDDRSGKPTYIGYKRATGFSESRYVLPNNSLVAFRYYTQDERMAEGGDLDMVAPDELMPLSLVDSLIKRTSTVRGKLLLTFTPIEGYTPTVAAWQTGMTVIRDKPAYLLPMDDKEPLIHTELGLTREELEELEAAELGKRVARAPESRPEDICQWLDDEGTHTPLAPEAAGRAFEWMPRVAKCVNEDMAVIWFMPSDNPYGTPRMVIKDNMGAAQRKGRDEIRCRVYGKAVKQFTMNFPKFTADIHCLPRAKIPPKGINYCLHDPAGDRSGALLYIRTTPTCDYVYREFPGNYPVPGHGVPGPWAKTSGRNKGKNDGDRDDGQREFAGCGLEFYRFVMAWLEGWSDFRAWAREGHGFDEIPDEDVVGAWYDENGTEEPIDMRYMDSRPAGAHTGNGPDRTTLLEVYNNNTGTYWVQAPGLRIEEGVRLINDALDFRKNDANEIVQAPKLIICDQCVNTIFALGTWQNADGSKGATKDWIDLLRYFYQAGLSLCGGERIMNVARRPRRSTSATREERNGIVHLPAGYDNYKRGEVSRAVIVRGRGGRVRIR